MRVATADPSANWSDQFGTHTVTPEPDTVNHDYAAGCAPTFCMHRQGTLPVLADAKPCGTLWAGAGVNGNGAQVSAAACSRQVRQPAR